MIVTQLFNARLDGRAWAPIVNQRDMPNETSIIGGQEHDAVQISQSGSKRVRFLDAEGPVAPLEGDVVPCVPRADVNVVSYPSASDGCVAPPACNLFSRVCFGSSNARGSDEWRLQTADKQGAWKQSRVSVVEPPYPVESAGEFPQDGPLSVTGRSVKRQRDLCGDENRIDSDSKQRRQEFSQTARAKPSDECNVEVTQLAGEPAVPVGDPVGVLCGSSTDNEAWSAREREPFVSAAADGVLACGLGVGSFGTSSAASTWKRPQELLISELVRDKRAS